MNIKYKFLAAALVLAFIAPGVSFAQGQTAQNMTTGPQLIASQNAAVGTQTVIAGSAKVRVGSYSIKASSTSMNVSNIAITSNVNYFQNLRLFVNGWQCGATQATVSQGGTYTFSSCLFGVTAGATVNVDVYADILSGATGSVNAATTLSGCTGYWGYYSTVACNAPVSGQGLTMAGAPSLAIVLGLNSPPQEDLAMGSTGVSLTSLLFAPYAATENVKITNLVITDVSANSNSGAKPAFNSLSLWNGSTLLGTSSAPTVTTISPSGVQYAYSFHFANPLIIPYQGNPTPITIEGNAAPYSSGGLQDNSINIFGVIKATDVTAFGAVSNSPAIVNVESGQGSAQFVLRTVLTLKGGALGTTINRQKASQDNLGLITATVNKAGPAELNGLSVVFSGTAVTSSSLNSKNISLLDQNGNNVVFFDNATESMTQLSNQDIVNWNFPSGTGGFPISAGQSYNFMLSINSTVIPGTASSSLEATIANQKSVGWTDGNDANALTNLVLPPNTVPSVINNVVYN